MLTHNKLFLCIEKRMNLHTLLLSAIDTIVGSLTIVESRKLNHVTLSDSSITV